MKPAFAPSTPKKPKLPASDYGEAANDAEAANNAEGDVDDNADDSEKSIIDWHRGIASAPEWEVNNSDE